MRQLVYALGWIVLLAASHCAAEESPKLLIVSAGKFDRKETIVSFAAPGSLGTGVWQLKDEGGKAVLLQVDPARQASFILDELKAGQSKTFSISGPVQGTTVKGGVEIASHGIAVNVTIDGKEVLSYQAGKTELPNGYEPQLQRGGYIFPVFTPSGKGVADDYPPNHKHHHGIWWAWTKTEFEGRHPDFWNMGGKSATVEFDRLDSTFGGPVVAGISARHKFIDLGVPNGVTALNEVWQVRVFNAGAKHRIFDLISTQECAAQSTLVLPKYLYGGLGVRGHREWDAKNADLFLTSEGKDRSNGNESRGRWCRMSGKVDGAMAGIAVLDHPRNFRAPQPMRLNPQEPFFCYAPSQLGEWKIEPGKPYVSRYRFVVSDGGPDPAELDRLWNDFAAPPAVELK